MLRSGYIAYFSYLNYHHDPHPLALILYADDRIVHCLNLNYLSNDLIDDTIRMIYLICTRKLTKNAYKLYHNYMKKYMRNVVQNAYRTYKPQYIKNIIYISKGFTQTISILKSKKLSIKKQAELFKRNIKDSIQFAKQHSSPIELKKIYNITPNQIINNVEEYFKQIRQIITQEKIDPTMFTGITRRKK